MDHVQRELQRTNCIQSLLCLRDKTTVEGLTQTKRGGGRTSPKMLPMPQGGHRRCACAPFGAQPGIGRLSWMHRKPSHCNSKIVRANCLDHTPLKKTYQFHVILVLVFFWNCRIIIRSHWLFLPMLAAVNIFANAMMICFDTMCGPKCNSFGSLCGLCHLSEYSDLK